jgi:hypothetical protein
MLNIRLFYKSRLPLLAIALIVSTAMAMSAQAHENRFVSNKYAISFGSVEEPPVANGENGLVLFAAYDPTGQRNLETLEILDTQAGDQVKIFPSVALRLATDNFNAQITQLIPLLQGFTRQEVEGEIGYVHPFTHGPAGAYGVFVSGFLKKVGKPGRFFAEKFVCGNGSQSTDGSFFECVEEPPLP